MRILVVTGLVLTIPLVAMQFTEEVQWNWFDFAVMGTLLIGTGLIYEFGVRRLGSTKQHVALVALLFVAMLLIWAELAVGIFGSPLAGS